MQVLEAQFKGPIGSIRIRVHHNTKEYKAIQSGLTQYKVIAEAMASAS